jgi:hypothetical protein
MITKVSILSLPLRHSLGTESNADATLHAKAHDGQPSKLVITRLRLRLAGSPPMPTYASSQHGAHLGVRLRCSEDPLIHHRDCGGERTGWRRPSLRGARLRLTLIARESGGLLFPDFVFLSGLPIAPCPSYQHPSFGWTRSTANFSGRTIGVGVLQDQPIVKCAGDSLLLACDLSGPISN